MDTVLSGLTALAAVIIFAAAFGAFIGISAGNAWKLFELFTWTLLLLALWLACSFGYGLELTHGYVDCITTRNLCCHVRARDGHTIYHQAFWCARSQKAFLASSGQKTGHSIEI